MRGPLTTVNGVDGERPAADGDRVPLATYRLQFNRTFTFHDALAVVPYLHQLGVTDVYASPLFTARAGSMHGYDVCDHTRLNPELGTMDDFRALAEALRARGMGLILDVVPNHMGIGDPANTWWLDVLENGPSSQFAEFFDIDWHPVKPDLANKVLLPVLEDQYGRVLENGKLQLLYEAGAFQLGYYHHRFPLSPRSYDRVLNHALPAIGAALPPGHADLLEYESIITAIGYLPPRTETSPDKIAERFREKEIIKRRLDALYAACPPVRRAIDASVAAYNGTLGEPRSFDLLDDLIDVQAYRLCFWRVATDEINYRRFFDINDLAAICVERPHVFDEVHRLVFELLDEGYATGLRIDHPDGLWDPPDYFRQLQQTWMAHRRQRDPGAADKSLYVVAEKILMENEPLPEDWAVDGTTGYDFLSVTNGLFVDSRQARAFDKLYQAFAGPVPAFKQLCNTTKKAVMLVSLGSEIHVLAHRLDRISERNRAYRDFTLNSMTFALREVIAALPVYRTYINGPGTVTEPDRQYIEAAVAEAKRRNPRTARSLFNFIRDTLLMENHNDFDPEDRPRLTEFVMKFQQLTGPVMAKGVEDTAFYVYNRLVSLNEVGGHPSRFGHSVADFHGHNAARQRRWPHTMLASSTHDTKRSEDVRARINVLSEIPDDWRRAVNHWARLNAKLKTNIDGEPSPDRNAEYLFYQTLVGAWPVTVPGQDPLAVGLLDAFRQRVAGYMRKAANEAKVHTSWVNPNEEYDAALQAFVERVLTPGPRNKFLAAFIPFQQRVSALGQYNALAQQVLKLAAPGVPDLYQGSELWHHCLVDPDNRRPVDFAQHQAILAALDAEAGNADTRLALARELLANSHDGRIKLFITALLLRYRREQPSLFTQGDYRPIEARGAKADHVVAFTRSHGEHSVTVVVPRLIYGLIGAQPCPPVGGEIWGDTTLPVAAGTYRNLFTGETCAVDAQGLSCARALSAFPVAVLTHPV